MEDPIQKFWLVGLIEGTGPLIQDLGLLMAFLPVGTFSGNEVNKGMPLSGWLCPVLDSQAVILWAQGHQWGGPGCAMPALRIGVDWAGGKFLLYISSARLNDRL